MKKPADKMKTGRLLLLFQILVGTFLVNDVSTATVPSVNASANCQSSVAPCICSGTSFSNALVTCNRVSVATVKNVFSKLTNTATISLTLTPNSKDTLVPANIIGKQKLGVLNLNCPSRFTNIKIDRAAFASAAKSLYSISVSNCDLCTFDWSFLTNFTSLSFFSVWASDNFHWTFNTFPTATLTSLNAISLQYIRNMNGFSNQTLQYPAMVPGGLTSVSIQNCYDFDDDALEHLMTKWVSPSSMDTIDRIFLKGNSLTEIPLDIPKFNKLTYVELTDNMAPMTIQSNAFDFDDTPANQLLLNNAGIDTIEANAFRGDFSNARIVLYGNYLETFDSEVFMDVLAQMAEGTGYLDVGQNPFDCDYNQCGLSWLIADNPELLDPMWLTQCANGTYFYDLNPNALANPDGTSCYM